MDVMDYPQDELQAPSRLVPAFSIVLGRGPVRARRVASLHRIANQVGRGKISRLMQDIADGLLIVSANPNPPAPPNTNE